MNDSNRHVRRRRHARFAAIVVTLGLAATAFAAGATASPQQGIARQKSGGDLKFGLEAETDTSNGYCLPRSQLAISGIEVVSAVYDTLTVPNDKGKFVPYLAKSVTPNADFTEWTIVLRPGVKFHDGTPLDSAALKLNLDTYAGKNPNQGAPLFSNVLKDIYGSTTVVDPLTLKVTLAQSVPGYDGYLYGDGRIGIAAPAQINAGADCSTKLIGTGPFTCASGCWRQNESLTVQKNPNYWQKGYPKANSITFVPVVEAAQRVTQLKGGQLDIMHTSSAKQIDALARAKSQFNLLIQQPGLREIRYYFVNNAKPPFNNPDARLALEYAIDRNQVNQIVNKGILEIANGIVDTRSPGYVKNAGYPAYNLKKAQALVAKVKAANGGQFNVTFLTTTDPENLAEAQLLQSQVQKAGMSADVSAQDQASFINQALGGNFGVFLWRNLHGGNTVAPDTDQFPWFGSDSVVNFGRIKDATLDGLLKQGRNAKVPAQINTIYQNINKLMAKDAYILPMWYEDWTIGSAKNVKVTFPPLPDGGGKPLFVYGRIPTLGLSKS